MHWKTIWTGVALVVGGLLHCLAQTNEIGPNVRLETDPPELPAAQLGQAEPHLIRSLTDSGLMIAAFQEGRFGDDVGGALGIGLGASRDGGQSWQRRWVPGVAAAIDQGAFDRVSDPVMGIGLDNSIFVATLGVIHPGSNEVGTIVLSRSTNGTNFGAPQTVYTAPDSTIFPDKEWMTINTFAGTKHPGRIVITFTFFSNNSQRNPIAVATSDDAGRTWSPPKIISPEICQASQGVFLPDGTLAVSYWDFSEPRTGSDAIEVAVSPDGGDTFQPPEPVTLVSVHQDPVARDAWFGPTLAADRQSGALFLAFQGRDSGPRIFFTRSTDRGASWTTPQGVNDAATISVFNPAIAVSPDGQHVTIVFYDKRNSTDDYHVDFYLAESFDAGDHWEPNVRVSEVTTDLRLAPLTPAGRMLGDYEGIVPAMNLSIPGATVWVDTRSGNPDPFSARIRRLKGSTYSTWARLRFSSAELARPEVSGESADPDLDGIPNLFEYVFGLEPRHRDAVESAGIQVASLTAGELAVVYERLAVLGDIDMGWESSSDLVHWNTVTPVAEDVSLGRALWFERVQARFARGGGSQQFFRLRARRRAGS